MYSGQDGQSDSDHTQPDRPNIRQINVMENPETKKTNDGLGDYEKADTGEGGAGGGAEAADGGVVDQPQQATYENVGKRQKDEGMKDEGKKDEGKKNEGKKDEGKKDDGKEDEGKKDTMVIVDPTSLDSGKGDCCTRFKKFCRENWCLVALVCILIFLCILFLGLYIHEIRKVAKVSATTSPTPTEPPTPSAVIQGIVTTTNNYSEALADPTSNAFKSFENSFIAAVICFYADNHKEYIAYYEDTQVTMIEKSGQSTTVHFEINFSQLDNDSELPDAHSVLSDQLNNVRRLGTFLIVEVGSLTINQNS